MRIKSTLFFCGILYTLNSCSYQNDYITTEEIGDVNGEHFTHTVYQTGIDNYRVEFKVTTDTIPVFNYHINDAVYSTEHSFAFRNSHDTLFISTPFQHCKFYYQTAKGTTIEVTNDANRAIKPCID